jgi:hypothetical protein
MGSVPPPTAFSIAKDGKYHEGTFIVEGDVVSVIYWAPQGVTRRTVPAETSAPPDQLARTLLSEMI